MFAMIPKTTETGRWKLDRLNALSDGVIAIAITLLVLGIEVPKDHDFSRDGLFSFLAKTEYALIVYAISFVLIGTFWVNQHAVFHYFEHSNSTLLWLNLFFLFSLTLLPLATQLMGTYRDEPLVVVMYGALSVAANLILVWILWYARRTDQILSPEADDDLARRMYVRLAIASALSLAAIGVAFLNVRVSHFVFLATPFVSFSNWTKHQHQS